MFSRFDGKQFNRGIRYLQDILYSKKKKKEKNKNKNKNNSII